MQVYSTVYGGGYEMKYCSSATFSPHGTPQPPSGGVSLAWTPSCKGWTGPATSMWVSKDNNTGA